MQLVIITLVVLVMTGLRSRVVLITGAVSRIGRATALSFAKSGAKLALIGLKREAEDSEELHASKKLGEIARVLVGLEKNLSIVTGQFKLKREEFICLRFCENFISSFINKNSMLKLS